MERVATMPRRAAAGSHPEVLATKLYAPPRQGGYVARPRLADLLDTAPAGALILVCAPAGFGKTALLADWTRGCRAGVAWLSLDGGDSDPARFWRHAIAALDGVRPGLAERVAPLLGPPTPASYEWLAAALVNDLAEPAAHDEVVLVLDDYHLIASPAVHESLTFLMEHAPGGLRLIVSSRADPPLGQARLRAVGRLVELRSSDLQFTLDESAALLRETVGADAPPLDDAVAALAERTEGWAAGLKLAALSIRGRSDVASFVESFSGSHRFVLDFLTEEVLQRQPEAVRTFLLETSLLERLSGPLCDATTGRTDGQAMLEEIERANLFLIPMDEVRGWWRYHHLFADLLRARLQQERPESVARLHRNAATWHIDHGLADDAVRHLLAAGDAPGAADVIERYVDDFLLARGEGGTVRNWLEALPEDTVQSRPSLMIAQATVALQGGDLATVTGLLDAAERPEADRGDGGREVRGRIATHRAYLTELRGDAQATTTYAQRALADLADSESMWATMNRIHLAGAAWLDGRLPEAEQGLSACVDRAYEAGWLLLATARSHHLGHVQRDLGNLDAELRTYERALTELVVPGRSTPPVAGIAHIGCAEVAYQRNDLDAAERHIGVAVPLCRQLGAYTQALAPALADLAWIRYAAGDVAGAESAMAEAIEVAPGREMVDLLNPVPAMHARLLLVRGEVDAVAAWTAERGLDADDRPSYPRAAARLVVTRLLLAQGDGERALSLLDRLLATAVEQGRVGSVIEIQALRGLAHAVRGDEEAGLDALAEAVALGAPGGWQRVFVDEGAPMAALLGRLIAARAGILDERGVSIGYLQRLGTAFADGSTATAAPPIPGLIERLTERELEVLRLLATGRSNREIAAELFVTLDTVKKHTTHILGKLGATNRTQAAARARELGLIS
jgi:LuxR family maltose regulon positive regulatory protein